jgi:hypothetical protein
LTAASMPQGRDMNKLTDFAKGIIAGFIFAVIIFSFVLWIVISNHKDKESIDYAEKQIEIETLRENVTNRDPDEFLDDLPDVRRAADGAAAEFERKRDEALQRFGSKLAN